MKVNKIADFINKSKPLQKVLRGVSDNPALASAGVAFVTASIFRPAAQGLLPIKDDKDRKYTIASSVATGVTELAFSALVFIPVNKLIQKTSKALYSTKKDSIYRENPLLLRQFKSLTSRFFKLLTMPATSWLRFAAVAPFVKILFGKDKSKGKKVVGGKLDVKG